MKIRQTRTQESLFGTKIPKWALVAYQEPTPKKPARYVWVEDVTTCGYSKFRIRCMNCATDEIYSYFGDVNRDSIARLFAKFADALPLECIRRPEWERRSDVRACGPHDRRPQVFDAPHKKPDNTKTMTQKEVIDGCKIGSRKYTREGYYHVILEV